ncbi:MULTISPECIES: formyltransferase family protein [unclassified Pseudomonas]|uniref:formyltransferase family protein n=1 Tax=unclassified Pseudomonas TaxID=196821 RepID=UPI001CBCCD60|nr:MULTISPECIES: formyltransferase family protein [unclassified Pseudomonas]
MLIGTMSEYMKSWQNGVNFAYLNFKDHPRGCEMLATLVATGHKPSIVIEELSELGASGTLEQNAVLSQLTGYTPSESVETICTKNKIPYRLVSNVNDDQCLGYIQDSSITLVVLGDTRIIRPHLIDESKMGIINVHPGVLPEVRGNNPYAWAVLEGSQQGVTVHFIDKGVDTGPILLKKILTEAPKDYPTLVKSLNTLCGQALVSVLDNMQRGIVNLTLQPDNAPVTRKEASKEIKNKANDILESSWKNKLASEAKC